MVKKHIILPFLFIFVLSSSALFALSLKSSAFFNQDMMPELYTCNGNDVSPDLSWKDIPKNTRSYALIVSDPDAPGGTFYHWVLFNLPANTSALTEGVTQLPPQTIVGKNSWGRQQYNGPCPPKGSTHRYILSLYALNTMLSLPANSDATAVLNAIQNHVLGDADLTVYYSH